MFLGGPGRNRTTDTRIFNSLARLDFTLKTRGCTTPSFLCANCVEENQRVECVCVSACFKQFNSVIWKKYFCYTSHPHNHSFLKHTYSTQNPHKSTHFWLFHQRGICVWGFIRLLLNRSCSLWRFWRSFSFFNANFDFSTFCFNEYTRYCWGLRGFMGLIIFANSKNLIYYSLNNPPL